MREITPLVQIRQIAHLMEHDMQPARTKQLEGQTGGGGNQREVKLVVADPGNLPRGQGGWLGVSPFGSWAALLLLLFLPRRRETSEGGGACPRSNPTKSPNLEFITAFGLRSTLEFEATKSPNLDPFTRI
jgi:hypothetical protein